MNSWAFNLNTWVRYLNTWVRYLNTWVRYPDSWVRDPGSWKLFQTSNLLTPSAYFHLIRQSGWRNST
ncbi:MAG: hypothetical protein ACOC90_08805 [Bacteroidota bacterium]